MSFRPLPCHSPSPFPDRPSPLHPPAREARRRREEYGTCTGDYEKLTPLNGREIA